MLQPACKVSEIRSDINKKRKQFLFRVTWPPEDDTDEEPTASAPTSIDHQGAKTKPSSRKSAKRKPIESSSSKGMSVGKIAALAVGGVAVGALTAGVGLVAGMVVVGMGVAASGGAAAITQGRGEKEKFLTLACDTYGDAERWTHAIETQIRVLAETLHEFPFKNIYGDNSVMGRNAPPEKKLESVQEWVRWSQWKQSAVLNGTRILERDLTSMTGPQNGEISPTLASTVPSPPPCLRVNMSVNTSTTDGFITLMNMPPTALSGIVKLFRVIESMDNHTDIVYVELDAVYICPTYTGMCYDVVYMLYCLYRRRKTYCVLLFLLLLLLLLVVATMVWMGGYSKQ